MKKIASLVIASMLVLSGCGGKAAPNDKKQDAAAGGNGSSTAEVKIGTLHPLTGAQAKEGTDMYNAVQLAVDEVNEAGGIKSLGGAKVRVVKADHEGKPEKGVSEVQRLNREGVVGIVGAYSSGVALPATQEAELNKIPFIVDIGVVDQITERNFKYTFRVQPPAKSMAQNFLNYVEQLNNNSGAKLKTAVLVHEDSVFGSGIASLIKENAPKKGIQVLAELAYPASTTDLSDIVNKIKSLNPDMLVATSYLNDGTMLVKGLKDANFKPKAMLGVANGAFSNAQFITNEKALNQYFMDTNYTINPKSEMAKKVVENYKKKYNNPLSANAAYSYTAAKVLLNAIETAASTDRDKIQKALTQTNITDHILPQGPIKFNATGQNENAQAVLNQIVDGVSKVVYPNEYKEADPVFPMP